MHLEPDPIRRCCRPSCLCRPVRSDSPHGRYFQHSWPLWPSASSACRGGQFPIQLHGDDLYGLTPHRAGDQSGLTPRHAGVLPAPPEGRHILGHRRPRRGIRPPAPPRGRHIPGHGRPRRRSSIAATSRGRHIPGHRRSRRHRSRHASIAGGPAPPQGRRILGHRRRRSRSSNCPDEEPRHRGERDLKNFLFGIKKIF